MKVLLDSNILLTFSNREVAGDAAVEALMQRNFKLFITPQNLAKYYVAATRPVQPGGTDTKPGKGVPPADALLQIGSFRRQFTVLRDTEKVLESWLMLLRQHQVTGRQAHDCRLAAYCKVYDIPHILTYDKTDFNRFTHLQVLHPDNIASKGTN